jgi:hypothetical protein
VDCGELLEVANTFLDYCPDYADLARRMAAACCDLAIWRTNECWQILVGFYHEFRRNLQTDFR